jgi:CHAT domain-containing protein
VRSKITADCRGTLLSFRNVVDPLYLEYAGLLLKQAGDFSDEEKIQAMLEEVLQIVEQRKTAEIQDYFKDACVTALESRITRLEEISPSAVALYPVLFPEKTVMILRLPDKIEWIEAPVETELVKRTAKNFRIRLENPENDFFMGDANRLYEWLIRPLSSILEDQSVDTLVFVPDGVLRTIPLAALHDGEKFLAERFSIVTTPGLTLTDPNPLKTRKITILLAGITESVQGFSALPAVSRELAKIRSLYESHVLKNEEFTGQNLEKSLRRQPYTVMHLATHGQFDPDPEETFIMTHKGKLTLNDLDQMMRLSQYRQQPVELLTLSACQTAAGNERAALGLAGVALKSGARSALATLWFIDDQAASRLVSRFYRELKKPETNKARALKLAQVSLLNEKNYRHPAYWAPFLLIGNWL